MRFIGLLLALSVFPDNIALLFEYYVNASILPNSNDTALINKAITLSIIKVVYYDGTYGNNVANTLSTDKSSTVKNSSNCD